MSLKFEKEKKKKGIGKSEETEGKEGKMKEFSLEEYSLFLKERMLLLLHYVYFFIVVSLKILSNLRLN